MPEITNSIWVAGWAILECLLCREKYDARTGHVCRAVIINDLGFLVTTGPPKRQDDETD